MIFQYSLWSDSVQVFYSGKKCKTIEVLKTANAKTPVTISAVAVLKNIACIHVCMFTYMKQSFPFLCLHTGLLSVTQMEKLCIPIYFKLQIRKSLEQLSTGHLINVKKP